MSTTTANRPKTVSQWLFQKLRDAIIRGDFVEGSPIRQDAIAAEYDVSRMPVREAMRLLEAEGLVNQVPHKGVVVAALNADDARELFEIRSALETVGITRSFPALTNDDIEVIEKAYFDLKNAKQKEILVLHRYFHLTLYRAAGMRLQKMIAEQLDAAQRYHLRFGRGDMVVSDDDDKEHYALVQAARAKNAAAAVRIIQPHVAGSGVSIAASIEERNKHCESLGASEST
ncbi:GntR family transcriptional regulator [Hyphococcus lacteus]|uniref:GntR family transcriptional regulator n=1 Tax=Hyphococcus lacteus TaxID=3143536 RepID=A0ABV3YZI4_9PROT